MDFLRYKLCTAQLNINKQLTSVRPRFAARTNLVALIIRWTHPLLSGQAAAVGSKFRKEVKFDYPISYKDCGPVTLFKYSDIFKPRQTKTSKIPPKRKIRNPAPVKVTGSKMARRITTRDAGTCTSEDNILVPIANAVPVVNAPMSARLPPEQPQQPPRQLLEQPPLQQPPLQLPQQPLQQLPQQPPPPRQPNERSIIMGMYRSLKNMDVIMKQLQEETKRHLREGLPRTLPINATGMMEYVKPAVVPLYVVNSTETKKCSSCNQFTESVCGTCRKTPYCSGFCMQKEWIQHEPHCKLVVAATAQGATEALLRS